MRIRQYAIVLGMLVPPSVIAQAPEPPIPSDPLELAGVAQPVQDVNQRADIVNLLLNAQRYSNVRTHPYDLKTKFTVFGSSSSDGIWQMEDTSPASGLYRWTIQSPSYSAVHLNINQVVYSNQPANSLPLRLVQAREAIFYQQPAVGPHASLRTANGNLDGVELTCALISHNDVRTGGRRWDEEEYCADPKAGTLVTYSLVPGLYVHYDYSKALHFHDKLIAGGFTITQGGRTVVEAETESVSDAAHNPSAFQPAGLLQIGVGPIMTAPWHSRVGMPLPSTAAGSARQIVVLHGMQSPDGKLTDVELLASSDAALDAQALAFASSWQRGLMGEEAEPGATPQSHEVLITVQYSSPRLP